MLVRIDAKKFDGRKTFLLEYKKVSKLELLSKGITIPSHGFILEDTDFKPSSGIGYSSSYTYEIYIDTNTFYEVPSIQKVQKNYHLYEIVNEVITTIRDKKITQVLA